MPNDYTPQPVWDEDINEVADGDEPNASNFNLAPEAIADRTEYLKDAIGWRQAILPAAVVGITVGTEWSAFGEVVPLAYLQNDTTDDPLILKLDLPRLGRMTAIAVSINGDGGGVGHASLPAVKPRVKVISIHLQTHVQADETAWVPDTPANLAAYEVPHEFGDVLDTLIDEDKQYFLRIEGENGANSVAEALTVVGARVYWEP